MSRGDRAAIHPVGVAHGRFQVLHLDHLKFLLAAKARCDELVVGITNPDPTLTRDCAVDRSRSLPESNPMTYYERQRMITAALHAEGLALGEFTVVPFPVNVPHLYRYYVPMDATFFLTIYDDWGREKSQQFSDLGLATEILWDVSPQDKGISGTEVRRCMAAGERWRHLVPEVVAELLAAWRVPERLRAGPTGINS